MGTLQEKVRRYQKKTIAELKTGKMLTVRGHFALKDQS